MQHDFGKDSSKSVEYIGTAEEGVWRGGLGEYNMVRFTDIKGMLTYMCIIVNSIAGVRQGVSCETINIFLSYRNVMIGVMGVCAGKKNIVIHSLSACGNRQLFLIKSCFVFKFLDGKIQPLIQYQFSYQSVV